MNLKNCKRVIKRIVMAVVSMLPFNLLRFANRNAVLILNYHSIQGWDVDEVIRANNTYRTIEEFENDIQFLKEKYHFIDLPTFISYSKREGTIPLNSVLLTFDDGLRVVYTHIRPILQKHNIPAVFFLNPVFIDNQALHYQRKKNLLQKLYSASHQEKEIEDACRLLRNVGINDKTFGRAIEKVSYKDTSVLDELANLKSYSFNEYLKKNLLYLSSAEINEMLSEGFYFGAHSLDHPNYNELSIKEQFVQTTESIKQVCDRFDLSYRAFAFPGNDKEIRKRLFDRMEQYCDVTFGVGGILRDEVQFHWHRVDVESSEVKASSALKFFYAKFIMLIIIGKEVFKRK